MTAAIDLTRKRAAEGPTGAAPVILYGPELAEPLPPVNWVCEGLKLAAGAQTNGAGNAYSGKSLAFADLVMAVATGTNAWSVYSCRRGRAVMIDYDGQGRRVSQERLQRLARGRGADLAQLANSIAYVRRPGFYLDDPDALDRLCKLLEGVTLCVIDSWRGATPNTDEWKRGPVQIVADRLETVSEKTGTAIVMVDHNVKPPRDGKSSRSSMHDVHGTTAKTEVAQSHFAFTGEEGEPLTHVKHVKERVTGRTIAPFSLRFEDVEQDGDPRWGLRVVYVDRDELKPETGSARFQQVLGAVREGLRRHPGAAGKDALAKLLGLNAGDVRAAVDHLVLTTGEAVAQRAPKNGVRLFLTEMAPRDDR